MIDVGKTYEIKKGKGPKSSTCQKYKITKKLSNGIVIAKNVEKGGSIITTEDSFNENVMTQAADDYNIEYNKAKEFYNQIKNYSKNELINMYMQKDPFGDEDIKIWLNGKSEKEIIKLILKQCFGVQGEDFLKFVIKEEGACAVAGGMAAMGPAPTPAFGQTQGTTVNGIPVEGKSVKKKKSKKNEVAFSGIVVEQDEIDNFNINDVKQYFKQNIQQQSIYVNCLQDFVDIVGKTWTETQSHIAKVPFFLLFKHLDYILMTSKCNNTLTKNNKNRTDGIQGWYYLYNDALFGQNLIQIKLDVAQMYNNKKLYFLRQPKKEITSGTPSNESCHVGRNIISNNIIEQNEQDVNSRLQIGKEYDLTPYFHITILKTSVNEDIENIEDKTELDVDNELIDLHDEKDEVRALLTKANAEENEAITSYLEKAKKAEEMGVPTLAKLFKELANNATVHTGYLQGALSSYGVDDIDNVIKGDTAAQEILKEDVEDDIIDFLDDELQRVANFKEKYEEISGLLAKQLDRMNFVFADTEDIIYKKEGAYKYLIKFDNENGILKFKVSQGDSIIIDKEWKLEEGQDISPIFKEIEDIYGEYGI